MSTLLPLLATRAALPDIGVFAVAAAMVLAGAVGVIVARNPVHSALMLIMTLFGVAVLFLLQQANFLAAVQVIVYAGAIVVLFLFVIMFLGVDRQEEVAKDRLRGQRPLAVALVALGVTGLLVLGQVSHWATGTPSVAGPDTGQANVNLVGTSLYTTYLFPFEATSALLIIAVVGAVVLARRPAMAPESESESESESGSESESASETLDDGSQPDTSSESDDAMGMPSVAAEGER